MAYNIISNLNRRREDGRPPGVSDDAWEIWKQNQLTGEVATAKDDSRPTSLMWPEGTPPSTPSKELQWPAESGELDPRYKTLPFCGTCGHQYIGYCSKCQPIVNYVPSRKVSTVCWQAFRDVSLFFGGLSAVAWEMFGAHTAQPEVLMLAAAMMGLPAFLRHPESSRGVGVLLVALMAAGSLLAASQGIQSTVRADRSRIRQTQIAACERVQVLREASGMRPQDCKILLGR